MSALSDLPVCGRVWDIFPQSPLSPRTEQAGANGAPICRISLCGGTRNRRKRAQDTSRHSQHLKKGRRGELFGPFYAGSRARRQSRGAAARAGARRQNRSAAAELGRGRQGPGRGGRTGARAARAGARTARAGARRQSWGAAAGPGVAAEPERGRQGPERERQGPERDGKSWGAGGKSRGAAARAWARRQNRSAGGNRMYPGVDRGAAALGTQP